MSRFPRDISTQREISALFFFCSHFSRVECTILFFVREQEILSNSDHKCVKVHVSGHFPFAKIIRPPAGCGISGG